MGSFSVLHWIIVGALVFGIYRLFSRSGSSDTDMVCKACGSIGKAEKRVRGSLAIEIILWLCFLIPGLIYSVWRLSSRYNACAKCGSAETIPLDSPMGQKLRAELVKPP